MGTVRGKKTYCCCIVLLLVAGAAKLCAQERPGRIMQDPFTALWLNSYGTFRLTDKVFWHGELHIRGNEHNNMPFFGKMSKWYNRHGVKYMFSKNFNATWGVVFRGNFTPDPGNPEYRVMVPEYRLWHEYNFANRFPRFMVYHRIRLEHRWSRDNREGSDFIYRNRWRYKIHAKYPLNKPRLVPGAFYLNPDVEIILQSGKSVVDSPLEDLRLLTAFGYIASPRVKYATGLMYTLGQSLQAGNEYRTRWILRFHVYLSLDFRDSGGR